MQNDRVSVSTLKVYTFREVFALRFSPSGETPMFAPILISLGLLFAGAEPPASPPIRYETGKRIAVLENPQINESSGLACSRLADGVFWTNNDSGDRPRVFAFNLKGENLAEVSIPGAAAVDWEDMCSFDLDGKSYLLLADAGDNDARRKSCTLYLVEEPKIDPAKRNVSLTAPLASKIEFTYEDGPRDCEAVAVDPTTRTVLLIDKRVNRKVYSLPIPKPLVKSSTLTARCIGKLSLGWVTAMDVSPDGRQMIALTYLSAYEYTRRRGQTWTQAFQSEPRTISVPGRQQGESVCYGRDGKTLYLTSEKTPTPLLELRPSEP
jgi:hypothetical protein